MYEVRVNALEVTGGHGVSEVERKRGSRLRISIRATVDGTADHTDRIEDTVDYGALAALAERKVKKESFKTLERLARSIGESVIQEFPSVVEVSVEIGKLDPPVSQTVESFGVSATYTRRG